MSDTNFHFLTVVSPAQFNNPRVFTMRLTSANKTSVAYTLNENPGLSHVFQFLFKGNVTLWADASVVHGSDAIVQSLFLDDAAVTYRPESSTPPAITNVSATTIASSQNPALPGAVLTFTATVSGGAGTPAGTVTFYDGSNTLGTTSLNNSGQAAWSTAALSVAGSPHVITADYGGNGAYGGSVSSVLSQVITNASATVIVIPLVNASFESPAGKQGTVAGAPVGWLASNKNPYGVYNPTTLDYSNIVNDILPSPAQGSQVLKLNAGNYMAQFLTNTLADGQTYTLSGAIGNRAGGNGLVTNDEDYVELWAGTHDRGAERQCAASATGWFFAVGN